MTDETPPPAFNPYSLPPDHPLYGNEKLLSPITELGLTVRLENVLKAGRIFYAYQLLAMTETDLLKTKNFGKKSMKEIREALSVFLGSEITPPLLGILKNLDQTPSGWEQGSQYDTAKVWLPTEYADFVGGMSDLSQKLQTLSPEFNQRAAIMTRDATIAALKQEDFPLTPADQNLGHVFNIPVMLDPELSRLVPPHIFKQVVLSGAFHDAVRAITGRSLTTEIDARIESLEAIRSKLSY